MGATIRYRRKAFVLLELVQSAKRILLHKHGVQLQGFRHTTI